VTTREHILELLQAGPRTPLDLIHELERERPRARDVRSMLLRLMSDGTVNFDVDGKIRLPDQRNAQPTTMTA
jgi:hypothetical protein